MTLLIECDGKSQMVVLRIVRPETWDRWTNVSLAFGRGVITLVATDCLAAADERAGYGDGAVDLLYQIQIIGRGDLTARAVRHIVTQAAGVAPMTVHSCEPEGSAMTAPISGS